MLVDIVSNRGEVKGLFLRPVLAMEKIRYFCITEEIFDTYLQLNLPAYVDGGARYTHGLKEVLGYYSGSILAGLPDDTYLLELL